MRAYLIRRVFAMVPMFFLMTAVYFAVQNYLPGGPVQEALARIRGADGGMGGGSGATGTFTSEDLARIRSELEKQYGLDQPIPIRYVKWVGRMVRLDFGDSIVTRRPALETIAERVPISLAFGIPGFFLTYLVCIALGTWKALRDGSVGDSATSVGLFIAYSVPSVVSSVLLLLVFCTDRVLPGGALFPLGGAYSENFEELTAWGKFLDFSWHLALPVLASLLGAFTAQTLLMKNSLLEVLHADFVRTARAKGLRERSVVFRHALRNAILPMMVGVGSFLSTFVAGSIVIESVFGLPGMGRLLLESLSSRDYNVLMGVAVIQSAAILVGQLVSDVAYVLVDPRIDFR